MFIQKKYLLMLVLASLVTSPSYGGYVFSGSQGSLAATADFTLSGNVLTVVLTNTSAVAAKNPAQLLTGLFFDWNGVTLTPGTAFLTSGSVVLNDVAPGGNVGGEWAYKQGVLAGAPGGATKGIGSTGLGIFGNANFVGPNLDGPASVAGDQYGITSLTDVNASNNPAFNAMPKIRNSVTFTLGVTGTAPASEIKNVWWQYGSSLSDPSFTVPEPLSVMVWGGLGAIFSLVGLRRRKKS